ncbi:chemotaxis protein CheX [Thermosulfurimonas marina]|uniref:Chemotaxis protein CheX n=1 Tax=Thermosulfurimonas marina TaxID=2047767 RepID=A0A6H1WQC7_9BACT|nr:chemotaxis protein CheX [Thermosulfurimonas marina]QJA05383.1 chemotaxis protein CheX [Thermosulfurimonas marina]
MSKLVNFIKEAVEEVIGTYTGKIPRLTRNFLKDHRVAFGEISAISGLTAEKASGAFVVSFSREALFEILASLFGTAPSEITPEVEDAAGEMANMICGAFRRRFEKEGISLSASTPSIVTGKDHTIHPLCRSSVLAVEFQLEGHPIIVEFCLDKSTNS